jgi:general secretion pathway protein K
MIVVLLLAGMLAALATMIGESQRGAIEASRVFADGVRAEVAMRAVIEQTVIAARGLNWSVHRGGTLHLAGAEVRYTISDEMGRIDINFAPAVLLAGAFRVAGFAGGDSRELAQRIVAWRDAGGSAGSNGERADAGSPTPSPARPFYHVAGLALVPGIPSAAIARIAPLLTVSSGQPKINPLAANREVLLALPDVNEAQVRDFLEARERQPVPFAQLVFRLGKVDGFVTDESSVAARYDARVRLGEHSERHLVVVVAVIPGDEEPYRILSWETGPT